METQLHLLLEALGTRPFSQGRAVMSLAGPGARPGGHFILLLCPERAELVLAGGRSIPLAAGNVFLLRARRDYTLAEGGAVELRFTRAFFDGLLLSQLGDCRILYDFLTLDDPAEEFLCFDYGPESPAWEAGLWLCREFLTDDSHTEKLLHCMTVQLLTLLQRQHREHLAVSRSTMIGDNCFGQILKYMGDHYDSVTLTSLAAQFNYNPSYLSTLFKRVTGETFSEKLFHIRMEQGRWALEHTDQTVQALSKRLGFKEKSYFLRRFKEQYGSTPSEYRRVHRQSKNPPG